MTNFFIKLSFIFCFIILYTPFALANNALVRAVQQEDLTAIQTLINNEYLDPNTRSILGQTALTVAAGNCYMEGIQFLLNVGGSPNVTDSRGNSPLISAASSNCIGGMRLLLNWIDDLADPNHQNKSGNTALRVAARNCYIEEMQILLNAGASPHLANDTGNPPLMSATFGNCTEGMQLLLTWDADPADPNHQNEVGDTAFMSAVVSGYAPTIEVLINAGGTIDLPNDRDITPLMFASSRNEIRVMDALLANGADPYAVNPDGENALLIAIREGHVEATNSLLDNNIDPNTPNNKDNTTAFMLAASSGHTEIMQALIDHNANLHAVNANDENAAFMAAKGGHTEAMHFLLDRGIDPNTPSEDNTTTFMSAASSGNIEIMQTLINHHNADPHAVNDNNENAVFMAARDGHIEALNFLLDISVDPNVATYDNQITPLIAAVDARASAVASNVPRAIIDNYGLPKSPPENYLEVIRSLLNKEADTSATNRVEVTALMTAAYNNDIKAAELLLAYDDNPGYTNSRGYSALTITILNGNTRMSELIEEAIDKKEEEEKSSI